MFASVLDSRIGMSGAFPPPKRRLPFSSRKPNKVFPLSRDFMTSYEKGISAETCAANLLMSKGYEILERRLRTQYGEIDILAKKGNDVVAVEVKQRKTLGDARSCISLRQQKRIFKSLSFVISNRNVLFENYRIDVICLDSVGRFEHIENAFQLEKFIDA